MQLEAVANVPDGPGDQATELHFAAAATAIVFLGSISLAEIGERDECQQKHRK